MGIPAKQGKSEEQLCVSVWACVSILGVYEADDSETVMTMLMWCRTRACWSCTSRSALTTAHLLPAISNCMTSLSAQMDACMELSVLPVSGIRWS